MDDIRSLREQRSDLEGKMNEVLLRNDSIDDVESIELLEKGEQRLAELDTQIRAAEVRSKVADRLKKPSFGFTPSVTSPSREDTQYRFVIDGTEVRVIGGGSAGSDATFTGNYGASIPVDLEAQIIRRLPVLAPIRSFFGVRRYSNDIELQRVNTRIQMTTAASTAGGNVTAESAAYTNEDMVLGRVRVRNFKTAAKSSVTEEFLRDARGDAVGEMLLQHSEEHGRLWDELYALGLGGELGPDPVMLTPTGLATASTEFATAADTPHFGIALEAWDNSVWAAFTTDAQRSAYVTQRLTQLRYDKIPAQYWGGMKWLVTQQFFASLTNLVDAFGRPLFQPFTGATPSSDLGIGTLLGLPVTITNNVTGDIGDSPETVLAVLAHSEDFQIFDRSGFEQQIDPYTRGDNGEVVYRTRMRSDGRWLRPYAAGMIHTVA
jgi:HK97 family phage major capsid protein